MVVHPNHGIGRITDITKMDLLEDFNRYYVINFLTKNLISHIPIRKTDDLGVRKTMSSKKIKQVFNTLRDTPEDLPTDYKKRKQQIEKLIFSGNPVKIAKAIRELTWRKTYNKLGTADSRMLTNGRDLLIEEIAVVMDSQEAEATRQVDEALIIAIESRQPHEET